MLKHNTRQESAFPFAPNSALSDEAKARHARSVRSDLSLALHDRLDMFDQSDFVIA